MGCILLTGGRVMDPASGLDVVTDVLLLDGKVAAVGPEAVGQAPQGCEQFDARGCVVCPGLIDGHVHLREPGQVAKETLATGTAAAARGGFTSVVCMPNTVPVVENAGVVSLIRERAAREGRVNVFVTGAITKALAGEELAPIGSLHRAGVVAITDDGHCPQNAELMRRAMEYARMFDLPVLDHCQDYALVSDGVMHEGYWSTLLGLPGWPAAGEALMVARDILLAELTGAHVHCLHVSCARSVELIRAARQRGVRVSGEVCAHHLTLTDAAVAGSDAFWQSDGSGVYGLGNNRASRPSWPAYDTNAKMNPPLRSAADRQALLEAVADGTLEMIVSDHAPHCAYEKEVEFDAAPFGITGLETTFSLALMQLLHSGRMELMELLRRFTTGPARVLRLPKGSLAVGADADVTVFDPNREWVFRSQESLSRSRNTLFDNWPLRGKVVATIVAGKIVWRE